MMADLRTLMNAAILLLSMTVLTGIVYPAMVTGFSQLAFSHEANGSLIKKGEKIVGSELIGQNFTRPEYFWGRPSATTPPYNAAASGASNWSPANSHLHETITHRVYRLQKLDPKNTAPIPVDLLTASASGLDPHISAAAAQYQVSRVARHRKMPEQQLRELVRSLTSSGFVSYGPERVNVLLLNLKLDETKPETP